MTGPRQHVIGYGRVSTEEQESNYSMDAQRSRFDVLCKQNRWQSLGFFPETGSGTSVINRPVLCNILQRIQQGGIDGLWVKETDRLSRPENLGDLSLISQTLEAAHTLLMVDSRSMDLSEDNSVLMLDFEGVLAKHFRRQLLRNMNRGRMRKAELGRKAAGGDIYGYRTNENGEYSPDPEEAKVVRLIFDLIVKDFTMRKIIAELKRRGILTARGRDTWGVGVLAALLRNDVYLGVYRFNKQKDGTDTDGSFYRTRRQDHLVVGTPDKPSHPPLVDKATFDLAQQKIRANRKKNSGRLYMATGLLRCPGCSALMHVKYSTLSRKVSEKGRIEKYVCSNRPHCPSKRLNVGETNDELWGALVQLLIQPERIHSLIAPQQDNDPAALKKELGTIERDEKASKEKQARLLDLYLEGNIPQASYVVKSSALEADVARLNDRKTELRIQIAGRDKKDQTTALIQTLRILARSHRRLTAEQKTNVFRSIVKEARLTATGVELELYVQPTQNVWWKYRQKRNSNRAASAQTVRIRTRQSAMMHD